MKGYKPKFVETANKSNVAFLELGVKQAHADNCQCDKCKKSSK